MVTRVLLMHALAVMYGPPVTLQRPGMDTAAVFAVVRNQLAVERGVLGRDPTSDTSSEPLALDHVELASDVSVKLYRVTPWAISHWHPYLVGLNGSAVLRLGGFASPDLAALALALRVNPHRDESLWDMASLLAAGADPNGAFHCVVPRSPQGADSAVVGEWRRRREAGWPSDTIVRSRVGGAQVVLTVLSQSQRTPGQPWYPIAYAFQFDANGALVAWASRKGRALRATDRRGQRD